jgi:class 3 adenylate cyclase/tetratricopeptide (TPR) repeat protein
MSDLRRWLDSLGLGQYADAFESNALEPDQVATLTDDELKELGVQALGHRKRIRDAVSQLTDVPHSAAPAPQSGAGDHAVPAREAERRQLTLMFVDLVGSTALSQRLDIEDLRDINQTYQRTVAQAVQCFEGSVARYMGDGVLAYFGFPQAHEDDAERAVRAGLALVEAVRAIEHATLTRLGLALSVRVGIATGPVIVGDLIGEGVAREWAVVGETPSLAARAESSAGPDSVAVAPTTYALTRSLFDFESMGEHRLKGVDGPVELWRAIAPRRAPSRFRATRADHLAPLVGRDDELALLRSRWQAAKSGEGQVVLLRGEAGIGKSRLAEALRIDAQESVHGEVSLQCSPYHQSSVLYPAIAALEQSLGVAGLDDEARLDELARHLERAGIERCDEPSIALLGGLLGIHAGEEHPDLAVMSAGQRRERALQLFADLICRPTGDAPVMCLVEDVHWADPTTLELLSRLADEIERLPVLVVVTARHEFEAAWTSAANVRLVHLPRLGLADSEALVRSVAGSRAALSDASSSQIVSRGGGNPLFIEELARTIASAADPSAADVSVPASLQDSLMSRLDRLAFGKAVAQYASVIGRDFDHRLLSGMWEGDPRSLVDGLTELEEHGIVQQVRDQRYRFRHALIQETAYQSILRAQRASLHARLVDLLRDELRGRAVGQPELLARHYASAALHEMAVSTWQEAAVLAANRSAFVEAIACLEAALVSLDQLPATSDSRRTGVEIRLSLRNAHLHTGDLTAVSTHLEEAERLAEELEDRRLLGIVSSMLLNYAINSGRTARAEELAERTTRIATEVGDRALQASSNQQVGMYCRSIGAYERCLHHCQANIDLLVGPLQDETFHLAESPALLSRALAGIALADVGRFEQGFGLVEEAGELSIRSKRPLGLIYVLRSKAYLSLVRGDSENAAEVAEIGLDLCTKKGIALLAEELVAILAVARARQGATDSVHSLLGRLSEEQILGGKGQGTFPTLPLIAESLCQIGQTERARALAESVRRELSSVGYRPNLASLMRTLGDCNAAERGSEAARCYEEALGIAVDCGMRPLAAHCLSGLGRLRNDRSTVDTARQQFRELGMASWEDALEATAATSMSAGGKKAVDPTSRSWTAGRGPPASEPRST